MLRSLLLPLALVLLLGAAVAANLVAHKPFTINPRLSNRKASVQTDKIICDFKFSTTSCEELKNGKAKEKPKEEEKKKNVNPTFMEYKQKISGECFSKLQGYWTYKVCLGDSVVQFHDSEQYTLGVYLSSENEQTKDTDIYKDGTECVVGDRRFKRKSNVKLMCGSSSAMISIQETETCVYSILVVHPQLCGEGSPFETYSGAIEAPPVVTKRVTDEDHWFLNIEKTDDESYICTVKNVLRDIKEEPTSCFTNFSLEFYHEDDQATKEENEDAENEAIRDKRLKSVVVRKDKRKYPSRQELVVSPKTHSVRNSKSFDGSLEYARIVMQ